MLERGLAGLALTTEQRYYTREEARQLSSARTVEKKYQEMLAEVSAGAQLRTVGFAMGQERVALKQQREEARWRKKILKELGKKLTSEAFVNGNCRVKAILADGTSASGTAQDVGVNPTDYKEFTAHTSAIIEGETNRDPREITYIKHTLGELARVGVTPNESTIWLVGYQQYNQPFFPPHRPTRR